MRRILLLSFLVIIACSSARAQWIAPQTFVSFDRPHGGGKPTHVRVLGAPQAPIPDWPFRNINVTRFNTLDQTEPSVAINPIDSNNIIIGAIDDRSDSSLWAYASTDGGETWTNQPLPGELPTWVVYATDPSVTFRSDGTAYCGNGHYRNNNYRTDVACYQSTNKGISWRVAGYPFFNDDPLSDTATDKYYFVVDQSASSPFHNRIYAAWVELTTPPHVQLASSYSSDGGSTWSKRQFFTGPGYYTAPVPAAAPDGSVIVSYVDYAIGEDSIRAVHSTNGGITWSAPDPIAQYIDIADVSPPGNPEGYPLIKGAVGVNSFPSIAVDCSSAHPGRAYVTWCGKDISGRVRVFVSTREIKGTAWSTPRAIDGDTSSDPTDKFFPWVAVDPRTGNVGIDFNDSRSDPANNILSDLYMAFSTDGGTSFTVRRISDASSDSRVGSDTRTVGNTTFQFFGDYIGIAGQSDRWYPVWTDSRSGDDLDIYTAIVEPFAPMPVSNLATHDTTINGKASSILTWQYVPETTFGYALPAGYQFEIEKDGILEDLDAAGDVSYIDTNTATGSEYEVTVRSGNYRSVTDSVRNGKSGVITSRDNFASSIRFSRLPAAVGREEKVMVQSRWESIAVLTLYDELGRVIGTPVEDQTIRFTHELRFTPESTGVRFYVLREITETGVRERAGTFVVVPE